jgi:hypothetical protein
MGYVLTFIIGELAGVLIVGVLCGSKRVNRENEIYMEGFVAGQESKYVDDCK